VPNKKNIETNPFGAALPALHQNNPQRPKMLEHPALSKFRETVRLRLRVADQENALPVPFGQFQAALTGSISWTAPK
jgi:hypothetical protein